jgi:DNA-binding CsgD family transcriptional regulator
LLEPEITWAKGLTSSSFQPIFTAFFLALAGRADEAHKLSTELPLLRDGRSRIGSHGLPMLILEAAAISRDQESAPVLQGLVRGDARLLATLPFVLVPRHLGALAALLGDYETAMTDYRSAIEFCERIGHRPELALSRFDLAQLLLARYPDERAEAIAQLDLAIAEFEAMGMRPYLERALRLRGRRVLRPTASTHPDGLTDREVDVLRLIAQGKSNKEMADQLALSIRTVERHIANAYMKTDMHGRAQATAYAIAHGLT